jgi:hypothetical protein
MLGEQTIVEFTLNNGAGILFGILMWIYATKTLKENTRAIQELAKAINSWQVQEEIEDQAYHSLMANSTSTKNE